MEQRSALSGMLQQLMKQRDQREQELRQVLVSTHSVVVVLVVVVLCVWVCQVFIFCSFTLININLYHLYNFCDSSNKIHYNISCIKF